MVENVTLVKNARNDQPSLDVSWNEPSSDRTILYYVVEYREMGMNMWTSQSPNPTTGYTILSGLMLNATYEVRVRARSDVGFGSFSDVESEITFCVTEANLLPLCNSVSFFTGI